MRFIIALRNLNSQNYRNTFLMAGIAFSCLLCGNAMAMNMKDTMAINALDWGKYNLEKKIQNYLQIQQQLAKLQKELSLDSEVLMKTTQEYLNVMGKYAPNTTQAETNALVARAHALCNTANNKK